MKQLLRIHKICAFLRDSQEWSDQDSDQIVVLEMIFQFCWTSVEWKDDCRGDDAPRGVQRQIIKMKWGIWSQKEEYFVSQLFLPAHLLILRTYTW